MFGKETGGEEGRKEGREGGREEFSQWKVRTYLKISDLKAAPFPGSLDRWGLHFHPRS